ncbi:MAG TPA: hypothetical protein VFA56_03170 [Gaiellaceae bacterium]|nr:hypothetical protein [Gaiellaceae bacterium]
MPICGLAPYSYAGVADRYAAEGVAATVELEAAPAVVRGHVAAWVGVGGVGMGPRGSNEWIQVGVAATPGSANALYYEVAKPGAAPAYVELRRSVGVGEQHRVAVIEMQRRPNWWRVWVDGRAMTRPIHLAQSHRRWPAVATSESWNGGEQTCNAFNYRFGTIRVRRDGWRLLQNASPIETPGYTVLRSSGASLLALGGSAQAESIALSAN